MISKYVNAAMRTARYEILDSGFFGDIPGFQGIWAHASTLEECREELADGLEVWVMVKVADGDLLPDIAGIVTPSIRKDKK